MTAFDIEGSIFFTISKSLLLLRPCPLAKNTFENRFDYLFITKSLEASHYFDSRLYEIHEVPRKMSMRMLPGGYVDILECTCVYVHGSVCGCVACVCLCVSKCVSKHLAICFDLILGLGNFQNFQNTLRDNFQET